MPANDLSIPGRDAFIDARHDGLDERSAMKTFLGKTAAEAHAMFVADFPRCHEDLVYMGTAAFRFYLKPAMQFLQSSAAAGDDEAAGCFLFVIDARLCRDADTLLPAIPDILATISRLLAHFDGHPEHHGGDLPVKCRWLADRLKAAADRG